MKNIFALAIVATVIVGFTSYKSTYKEFDKQLVGTWKGFEKDQQIEGIEKHWIMQRSKDGTFLLMFTTVENCEVNTTTEKGKWWTEKGKFYEWHEDSNKTDVYTYQVIDGLMVKFKSQTLLGQETDSYEFTDYKME